MGQVDLKDRHTFLEYKLSIYKPARIKYRFKLF